MTVIKLSDGRLVIHSAVALSDSAQRELEAWGEPAFIVIPNGYHRIDAPSYKARYPNAKVLCGDDARARAGQVVAIDGNFSLLPKDAALSCSPVRGSRGGEHVFRVQSGARASLVLNDILFNHPHVPGFKGFLLKAIGSSGSPRVTNIARLALLADKAALRAHFLEMADIPGLARVIVSHVDVIDRDPAGVLRQVAASL
jgi:hypothetical protein